MATVSTPTSENPVGKDGPGGQELDVKNYQRYMCSTTKHTFIAPVDKYKDVATELGLINIDADVAKGKDAKQLKHGTGFVYLSAVMEGGGVLQLVCDISSLGNALSKLVGKAVYGKKIKAVRIPKKRILR